MSWVMSLATLYVWGWVMIMTYVLWVNGWFRKA